jgi:transcriptional regulator with XRE-family HTH domain
MSGTELREKLDATGLQKAAIAEKLGLSPQHLQQQLRVADVKSSFLEKVCKAFGWTMGQLYGETATNTTASLVAKENEDLRNEIINLHLELARLRPQQKAAVG